MKEQLALLIALQTLDRKRQDQKAALDQLPEKIAAAEVPLIEAREASESTQNELDALAKENKEKELSPQDEQGVPCPPPGNRVSQQRKGEYRRFSLKHNGRQRATGAYTF